MTGRCGLGVACGHIKAFGFLPFPHQICAEGLQGRHAGENIGTQEICIAKKMCAMIITVD